MVESEREKWKEETVQGCNITRSKDALASKFLPSDVKLNCQKQKAPFGVQRITEKEGQWRVVFLSQLYFGRLYFCLSCILKVVFLSQLYFESCILV